MTPAILGVPKHILIEEIFSSKGGTHLIGRKLIGKARAFPSSGSTFGSLI